ncbi:type VI secretion system ATPase TssH [Thorsellia anophelis]|uniref:Type VI secretion system protein VasG n=1 Tax=Thorsellia anophelis DSM 18579 TaxID=1123402 RepID=A0A1I0FCY4_9GAMM|nr:type VI secretion system ATPase TssH [Thorsellia anophelis]SET55381.1 type VI secretion system protein VasG [Thorsellia anophelis DSM 18579]
MSHPSATHSSAKLLRRLHPYCAKALDAAAQLCQTRAHAEITIEHWLLKLLEQGEGDITVIARRYEWDIDTLWEALLAYLGELPRSIQSKPQLSNGIFTLLNRAWVEASLNEDARWIRSVHLLSALTEHQELLHAQDAWPLLSVTSAQLSRLLPLLDNHSEEGGAQLEQQLAAANGSLDKQANLQTNENTQTNIEKPASTTVQSAQQTAQLTLLNKFTEDITAKARAGKIDPVFGRDVEIRQMIDILSRRRKNNPILVGEPGVGKTALVEGLALRIAEGDVPESLKPVVIRTLDLGLLQAGAGVKGEFEQRLKNVIEAVQYFEQHSDSPILLFIDEAHTIIGAGNQAGSADAANLLKPALARGELRTIAATTWSEYKQYFEKDAALERRFQPIKVDEPDDETAALMLRGLKARYASHHGVHITDDAVKAAVQLSRRYITGRQLPDKAVDLLDTASARVRMSLDTLPDTILRKQAERHALNLELEALQADIAHLPDTSDERIAEINQQLIECDAAYQPLYDQFQTEHVLAKQIIEARIAGESTETIVALMKTFHQVQGKQPLIALDVDVRSVATVIADWTGVPLSSLLKDEQQHLLQLEQMLAERVRGQSTALSALAERLRTAKAGLACDQGPLGVFLLVGPSGVGKTETAHALADQLFGGESALVTINLSEYQESHTVSQLKGSPPGYVGYGQGGILTEAVRKRPYSVILLDEVEKAHRDVLNLFYQVFDRGMMRDGEGREIDFRNTVIVMTSNLGSDELMALLEEVPEASHAQQQELLRPILREYFQPALLARFQTLIYTPLDASAMREIVELKLAVVKARLNTHYGLALQVTDAFYTLLVNACLLPDTGARNIDSLLNQQVLPALAVRLLGQTERALFVENKVKFDYSDEQGIVIDFR